MYWASKHVKTLYIYLYFFILLRILCVAVIRNKVKKVFCSIIALIEVDFSSGPVLLLSVFPGVCM